MIADIYIFYQPTKIIILQYTKSNYRNISEACFAITCGSFSSNHAGAMQKKLQSNAAGFFRVESFTYPSSEQQTKVRGKFYKNS